MHSPLLFFTDNYQGKKSDIAIISLTQSNTHSDIRFMTSPKWLNILLSHAQDVLFMIGNIEIFMSL